MNHSDTETARSDGSACDIAPRRPRGALKSLLHVTVSLGFAFVAFSGSARGQSLDERLDSERYIRGLRDLQLPEVLEHFLRRSPAATGVEKSLQSIALQQAALANVAGGAERVKAVESLLAARAELIETHPADPRRAVWLADQASDLFFEWLSIDALNLTALFGLPDEPQKRRATETAARMNELAQQAEQAIDGAIRAIEGAPGFARDVVMQQRRRNLADVERDRRIPFLRGVASYLDGELNRSDPTQRTAAFEVAAQTLAPLIESLEGSLALTAKLYEGYALARLGRYDEAETQFRAVATDSSAAPADVFAARMGGVLNRLVKNGPASAIDGLTSIEERYRDPGLLFYRVLLADQRFRLLRQQAQSAPSGERNRMYAAAFGAYTDLLQLDYPTGTVSRETLRAIVFSRLTTAAASGDVPTAGLPPIVAIAQADAQTRDPATREQAIIALEGALKSSALTDDDRASALFSLGRALYEAEQPLLAAQRFVELARDHAADPQAERSIELAATLAWDEHRAAPGDAEVRGILRETLEVLLAKYSNLRSIDRWQYAAGRLALIEGRFDDAAQRFAKVTPDAGEWLDANFMLAATARERAVAAGSGSASKPLHDATRQAIAKVRPIIEQGLSATSAAERRASLQYYLAMLKVYGAEAMLGMGEPQKAIDALAGIERQTDVGSEVIGEAMRVRINAYQTLQPPKPDEALRDLQQFVQAAPKQAGAVLQPMIASLSADVQKLIDAGQDAQAKDLATRTLLPAAKTLQSWLQSPDAPADSIARAALERRVADAFRFAGDCDGAQVIYRQLLRTQGDAAEIILGLAECLFVLGGEQNHAEAMGLYKRLAAAGPAAGLDAYWLSQLRMLQILDLTGRGTQQIIPRIERLRQGDPNFGGERYRQGFEALRAKHGGRAN